MEKRRFDKIGKDVSLLGFGCMRLPKVDENKPDIDFAAGFEMVDMAIKSGVNYFDTAWIYHEGTSEVFIGEALKRYPRESFMLADKLPIWLIKSEEDIRKYFEKQLERCQVEYFDFYLLHALDKRGWANAQKHDIYNRLLEFKKEGKIRKLGFSFHDSPQLLEEIADAYEWDFAQIQLNYLDWDDIDAKRQYEILAERKIPIVVMEPVRGGALATLNDTAVSVLKKANPRVTTASWALRYAASFDNILTVLSGMSNADHVNDNIRTMTDFKPIDKQELAIINEVAFLYRERGVIPCTGCKYCMDCPYGVNIPRIFSIYNNHTEKLSAFALINGYKSLKDGEKADNCISCGACVENCPQHIDIPAHLKKIDEEIKAIKPR